MGLGQIFLTRIGSGQPSLVWVWVGEISPKNPRKISSGQVKKYPFSKPGRPLIYRGSKYARVGLGQGPSLNSILSLQSNCNLVVPPFLADTFSFSCFEFELHIKMLIKALLLYRVVCVKGKALTNRK